MVQFLMVEHHIGLYHSIKGQFFNCCSKSRQKLHKLVKLDHSVYHLITRH